MGSLQGRRERSMWQGRNQEETLLYYRRVRPTCALYIVFILFSCSVHRTDKQILALGNSFCFRDWHYTKQHETIYSWPHLLITYYIHALFGFLACTHNCWSLDMCRISILGQLGWDGATHRGTTVINDTTAQVFIVNTVQTQHTLSTYKCTMILTRQSVQLQCSRHVQLRVCTSFQYRCV